MLPGTRYVTAGTQIDSPSRAAFADRILVVRRRSPANPKKSLDQKMVPIEVDGPGDSGGFNDGRCFFDLGFRGAGKEKQRIMARFGLMGFCCSGP